MTVSAILRARVDQISERWVTLATQELAPLRALTHEDVIDHLPAFIDGLAAYVDGGEPRDLGALLEVHAAQRVGEGIDLRTVMHEYALLRSVMLELVLAAATEGEVIRMQRGLDAAVSAAAERYLADREEVRGRFLKILGHDLRNPLHAVTVAADTLKHSRDPHAVEAGAVIADGAAKLREVVQAAIDLATGRSRS